MGRVLFLSVCEKHKIKWRYEGENNLFRLKKKKTKNKHQKQQLALATVLQV